MKKFLFLFLTVLLLAFSCKDVTTRTEYNPEPKAGSDTPTELNVQFYYDYYNNLSVKFKADEIKLPRYIFSRKFESNENIAYNDVFSGLKKGTDNEKEYVYLEDNTPIYLAIQVDWYLDKNFESKVDKSTITKNSVFYAKPLALFEGRYKENRNQFIDGEGGVNLTGEKKEANHLFLRHSLVDELEIVKNNDILHFGYVNGDKQKDDGLVNLDLTVYSFVGEGNPSLINGLLYAKKSPKKIIFDSAFFTDYYDGEVKIESYYLGENNEIEEIVINGDLKSIATISFTRMSVLKNITINGNIGTIEKSAFYNLPALEKVAIKSCTNLNDEIFNSVKDGCKLEYLK